MFKLIIHITLSTGSLHWNLYEKREPVSPENKVASLIPVTTFSTNSTINHNYCIFQFSRSLSEIVT